MILACARVLPVTQADTDIDIKVGGCAFDGIHLQARFSGCALQCSHLDMLMHQCRSHSLCDQARTHARVGDSFDRRGGAPAPGPCTVWNPDCTSLNDFWESCPKALTCSWGEKPESLPRKLRQNVCHDTLSKGSKCLFLGGGCSRSGDVS